MKWPKLITPVRRIETGKREPSAENFARAGGTLRQKSHFVASCLLACLVVLDLGGQAPQTNTPAANDELKVETSCSKVSPGAAVADVSWRGSKSSVSRAGKGTTTQVQLLVTTVKDGFSTGAAVKIWPNSGNERVGLGLGANDHRLDPLRSLAVAPVPKSPASARIPNSTQTPTREESLRAVRIQNLQPGINYIWRIQRVHDGIVDSSNTITTAAPVCAVDYKN